MLDNIKIGNQITLLRKEKNLTGEKLAELWMFLRRRSNENTKRYLHT